MTWGVLSSGENAHGNVKYEPLTEWLTESRAAGFVRGLGGIMYLAEMSWKFPVFLK